MDDQQFKKWKEEVKNKLHQEFAEFLKNKNWKKYSLPQEDNNLTKEIRSRFHKLGNDSIISKIKENCIRCYKEDVQSDQTRSDQSKSDEVVLTFFNVYVYTHKTSNENNPQSFPVVMTRFQEGEELRLSSFVDHNWRVYKTYSGFLKQNNFDGISIAVPEFPKVDLEKKGDAPFSGIVEVIFIDKTILNEGFILVARNIIGIVFAIVALVLGLYMGDFLPNYVV